jgi:nitrogen fixation NifU-like protein
VVLEHYRRPRNREPLADADGSATVHNPVCGDQVRVGVRLDGREIAAVSATTRGCSIAVAAGSVMSELTRGGTIQVAGELHAALRRLLDGEPPSDELDPRLCAFAGVAPLRSRHRCALLAWEALDEALREAAGKSGGTEPTPRSGPQ